MRAATLLVLLIACVSFLAAPAEAQGLREPRVVDVSPAQPGVLSFFLHDEPIVAGSVVVVAASLLEGDGTQVTLSDGEALGSWSWERGPGEGLEARRFVSTAGHAALNATLTAAGPARVLLYMDASCACASKEAPFPGAILAFQTNVTAGDAVLVRLTGAPSTRFEAEALMGAQAGTGVARAGSHAGVAELRWVAQEEGPAYVLVTMEEGGGSVAFEAERTPGVASARIPAAPWIGALALALAAWRRR